MSGGARVIAVSACLLGEPVRYDGRDKRDPVVRRLLAGHELLPFCPELGIGLGVPRAPIQLCRDGSGVRLVDREDTRIDHSEAMRRHARAWLTEHPRVAGLVVKTRSPSCALHDTPLFGMEAETLSAGLFTMLLQRLRPDLAMIDEQGLRDAVQLWHFLERVAVN